MFLEKDIVSLAKDTAKYEFANTTFEDMKTKCVSNRKTTFPEIKKVIFSNPATIVMWGDGTKTVVKAQNEEYDLEKGLALCYVKKFFGNKGNYWNKIKEWLPEEQ